MIAPPRPPSPLLLLSPHPDDLCYSIGAMLAGRDCSADVATVVFTGSRLTPAMSPRRRDQAAATAMRCAEDLGYLGRLGLTRIDLGLPDCTVRSADSADWFWAHCPPELVRSLAAKIGKIIRARPGALVMVPLGVGGNVDHLMVREAVLRVVAASDVAFYEDLPYAARTDVAAIARAARSVSPELVPVLFPMHDGTVGKVATAAASYPSQFRAADAFALIRHAIAVGGAESPAERVWMPLGRA